MSLDLADIKEIKLLEPNEMQNLFKYMADYINEELNKGHVIRTCTLHKAIENYLEG